MDVVETEGVRLAFVSAWPTGWGCGRRWFGAGRACLFMPVLESGSRAESQYRDFIPRSAIHGNDSHHTVARGHPRDFVNSPAAVRAMLGERDLPQPVGNTTAQGIRQIVYAMYRLIHSR